jgi:hypothetical protein
MILSLEDLVSLFEGRFTLQMLQQLERHIFMINKYRVNPATPLDFLLHFVTAERSFWEDGAQESQVSIKPENLIDHCLPVIHYAMIKYKLSRRKYSSIAIAVVCHILQQNQEPDQNHRNSESLMGQPMTPWLAKRDAWLLIIANKYPQINLDDVFSVLT